MTLAATNDPGVISHGGVTFAMQDGDKRVSCHVNAAALEQLGEQAALDERQRIAVFQTHREHLEAIARRLYEAARTPTVTAQDLTG